MCHSIWDLLSNLVWVNLIHLASSSWLTIPSAFSSILFQRCISGFLNFFAINPHQGEIITCPQWPPISSDSPQDLIHQTPPPGPRQGTPRGHSRGRGRRGAGGNQRWSCTSRCRQLTSFPERGFPWRTLSCSFSCSSVGPHWTCKISFIFVSLIEHINTL